MNIDIPTILAALSTVRYPGSGKTIVEMGIVSADSIRIDGRQVYLSLTFAKANDPFRKSVVKAAETAVKTYVGADINVQVSVGALSRQNGINNATPLHPTPMQGIQHTIAIYSGKGGVGKSTVAVNLAISLTAAGCKVGLLDADIYGPSIPKMFGEEAAQPAMETIDGKDWIMPVEKFGIKILSIGFFVGADKALAWRGSMASNALKQLLTDAYWGELDYLLIDMPPGTGDIHLTLLQTVRVSGAIIVTTPQEVALADARKGVNLFQNEKIGVPILGLVENMAWFTPAEMPNNRYYIFGKDGGKRLAEELNVPLLGQIPLVQGICEGGDKGAPTASFFDDIAGKLLNYSK